MANIRDIKRQIVSVHNTQKVTGAMKMVSAAKMRRTNDTLMGTRPYENKMKEIMLNLLKDEERRQSLIDNLSPNDLKKLRASAYKNPFLSQVDEVKTVALIVVNSDRGLCGGFNILIEKQAHAFIKKHSDKVVKLYVVGKNAYDAFRRSDFELLDKWITFGGKVSYETGKEVADVIKEAFLNKKFDELHIAYNKMHSLSQQSPVVEQLLPLTLDGLGNSSVDGNSLDNYQKFIYEPNPHKLLDELIPRYINLSVYHKLLESAVGEHKARMVAMDNATSNAEDMVKKLQLNYNKARQAAITTDLLDILNGAEALK